MRRLAERIRASRRVLLSTHSDPDGDGIGALLALTIALKRTGVEVDCLLPDPCPERFRFLDPDGYLRSLPSDARSLDCERPDLVLILDTHRWALLGRVGELIRAAGFPTIFLDHHPVGGVLREDVCGDADASSTGELVYRLLHSHLDLPIDSRVGECLYTAIAYDTHSFRYVRNSPSPHLIAADLLSRGVDATHVYRHLFASNPVGKMRLLGEVLGAIEIREEGRLAYAELSLDAIRNHECAPDDLRDAVNYLLEVSGVEVAVLLKEAQAGEVKVSLRSKGRLEVQDTAQTMGGGGHPFAAGATLSASLPEARAVVLGLLTPLLDAPAAGCCSSPNVST
jgi:bifunctional oligoribonuclease and PAP phosphatase NrnA